MMPGDGDPQRLSDLWDAFLSGQPSPSVDSEMESALFATIHDLYELDDAPAPDPAQHASIWRDVTGEVWPAPGFTPLVVVLPSVNGKAVIEPTTTARADSALERGSTRWLERTQRVIRVLAIAALAGFSAGFLTGVGARLAMRLAGLLTVDRNRGLLTENNNVVGQITLGGTLALALIAAFAGVFGGLLYVAIRSRLPQSAWLRGLTFGGLLLAVFGFVVMDEHNPDYQLFGPPVINVMTFSLIYLLFGVVVAPIADLFDRVIPRWTFTQSPRGRTAMLYAAMLPLSLFALLSLLIGLLIGGGASVVVVIGLGVIAPLLWWTVRLMGQSRRSWLQPAYAGYLVIAASCLVGFVLTVRGIAGILGAG